MPVHTKFFEKPTTRVGRPRRRWALAARALVVLGALGVVSLAAACGSSPGNSSATRTTATIPARSGPMTSFGNGLFTVGTRHDEIPPGTYRTNGGHKCYWARVKRGTGPVTGLVVSNFAVGPAIVTIQPTDVAFQSQQCGSWSLQPHTGVPATSFGDGTWAVGIDIAPGTYHASGGVGCSWERLSLFGAGDNTGIIEGPMRPLTPTTVTILPTDKGFSTSHCGRWTMGG